jgi:hypothetical protein
VSARPAILVYGLHDPVYARLLPHLSRGNRHELLLLDASLAAAAREAGLAHRVLRDTAPPDPLPACAAAQRRAAELFLDDALDARLGAHFRTPDGIRFWPGIRAEFARVLEEALTDGVLGVETAAHALRVADVRVAVGGYDMTAFARGLIGAFDRAGVPSLHVPHGVFGPTRGVVVPGTCSEIAATRVAAPGEFSRAVYAENGQPLDRVVVTGAPRWDLLPALQARPPAAWRERLGLAPERPLLLFGTTWVEWVSAHAGRYTVALAPIVRAFFDGARRLAGLRPHVVVKLHPAEASGATAAALLAGYRALGREAGLDDVAVVAGPVVPWLGAADVVVSVNSNLALEAVIAGRVAVNVPAHPDDAHVLHHADGAVLTVPTPAALAAALEPALCDPALGARLRARRADTVRLYNHADDARAAERVAAAALGLLAGARPVRRPAPPAPLASLLVVPGSPPPALDGGVPSETIAVTPAPGEDVVLACTRAAARAAGRFLVVVDARVRLASGWLAAAVARAQRDGGRLGFGGGGDGIAAWAVVRRGAWPGVTPGAFAVAAGGGLRPGRSCRPRQEGRREGPAAPAAADGGAGTASAVGPVEETR